MNKERVLKPCLYPQHSYILRKRFQWIIFPLDVPQGAFFSYFLYEIHTHRSPSTFNFGTRRIYMDKIDRMIPKLIYFLCGRTGPTRMQPDEKFTTDLTTDDVLFETSVLLSGHFFDGGYFDNSSQFRGYKRPRLFSIVFIAESSALSL